MSEEGTSFLKHSSLSCERTPTTTNLKWKDATRQIFASLVAISIVIPAGINLSFSAILLPQLYHSKELQITKSEASWIASLVTISLPIGTILAGVLMDKFGRKKANIFATIPFAIAWIVNATAQNVGTIYFARLLAGAASGLTTVPLIYISEITHPNFRPMLLSTNSIFVSLGILVTCVLGYWCHWRTMCYIFFAFQIILLGFLLLIPESPYWFAVFKNDSNGAGKSLQWLYRNRETYNSESLRFFSVEVKASTRPQSSFSFFKMSSYSSPTVYKPFIILAVLFIIQQLTGAYVIVFYAIDIFTKVSRIPKSTVNEEMALILLGVLRFLSAVVATVISKRLGRKILLFVSGVGMFLLSLITGVYLHLLENSEGYNQYIPLVCILFYVCLGAIGYLLIPWTLISELLPVIARGKLGGVLIGLAYVYMFGIVKAFPFILDAVTLATIFCTLAIINVLGVCFVQYFVPETLGKRFSEIEKHFVPSNLHS